MTTPPAPPKGDWHTLHRGLDGRIRNARRTRWNSGSSPIKNARHASFMSCSEFDGLGISLLVVKPYFGAVRQNTSALPVQPTMLAIGYSIAPASTHVNRCFITYS